MPISWLFGEVIRTAKQFLPLNQLNYKTKPCSFKKVLWFGFYFIYSKLFCILNYLSRNNKNNLVFFFNSSFISPSNGFYENNAPSQDITNNNNANLLGLWSDINCYIYTYTNTNPHTCNSNSTRHARKAHCWQLLKLSLSPAL